MNTHAHKVFFTLIYKEEKEEEDGHDRKHFVF